MSQQIEARKQVSFMYFHDGLLSTDNKINTEQGKDNRPHNTKAGCTSTGKMLRCCDTNIFHVVGRDPEMRSLMKANRTSFYNKFMFY